MIDKSIYLNTIPHILRVSEAKYKKDTLYCFDHIYEELDHPLDPNEYPCGVILTKGDAKSIFLSLYRDQELGHDPQWETMCYESQHSLALAVFSYDVTNKTIPSSDLPDDVYTDDLIKYSDIIPMFRSEKGMTYSITSSMFNRNIFTNLVSIVNEDNYEFVTYSAANKKVYNNKENNNLITVKLLNEIDINNYITDHGDQFTDDLLNEYAFIIKTPDTEYMSDSNIASLLQDSHIEGLYVDEPHNNMVPSLFNYSIFFKNDQQRKVFKEYMSAHYRTNVVSFNHSVFDDKINKLYGSICNFCSENNIEIYVYDIPLTKNISEIAIRFNIMYNGCSEFIEHLKKNGDVTDMTPVEKHDDTCFIYNARSTLINKLKLMPKKDLKFIKGILLNPESG